MTLMRFDVGGQSLQFEVGGSYPSTAPTKIFSAQDRTAAGTLQYEALGITLRTRAIEFINMPVVDYLALLDWFENVAEGGKNEFQFTDEYGAVGDVVITDDEINLRETQLGRYSGRLNLEYVGAIT